MGGGDKTPDGPPKRKHIKPSTRARNIKDMFKHVKEKENEKTDNPLAPPPVEVTLTAEVPVKGDDTCELIDRADEDGSNDSSIVAATNTHANTTSPGTDHYHCNLYPSALKLMGFCHWTEVSRRLAGWAPANFVQAIYSENVHASLLLFYIGD